MLFSLAQSKNCLFKIPSHFNWNWILYCGGGTVSATSVATNTFCAYCSATFFEMLPCWLKHRERVVWQYGDWRVTVRRLSRSRVVRFMSPRMLILLGIECDFIILYLYMLHVMDGGPDDGRSERCWRHLGSEAAVIFQGWRHLVKSGDRVRRTDGLTRTLAGRRS